METDLSQNSPWHPGELEVQKRIGVQGKMAKIGVKVIRDYMPDQHREFFYGLPMMLMGASDSSGRVWASAVFGDPGFIQSPTSRLLTIDAQLNPFDPLAGSLEQGEDIGLLGLELSTRRRNRMNARLESFSDGKMFLSVKQSFGNCAKYIQQREYLSNTPHGKIEHQGKFEHREFSSFDDFTRKVINSAATFFIASRYKDNMQADNRGVDVSHRGGEPGFIKIDDESRLLVPDYVGNNFFNTIGNLTLDSSAGLLFMDFQLGSLIYLSGTCEVVWAEDEPLPFENVERMLRFSLEQGHIIGNAMPKIWRAAD